MEQKMRSFSAIERNRSEGAAETDLIQYREATGRARERPPGHRRATNHRPVLDGSASHSPRPVAPWRIFSAMDPRTHGPTDRRD